MGQLRDEIWKQARAAVKMSFDAMPEAHRSRCVEVAESEFKELVAEIKNVSAKFEAEESTQQLYYLARRYQALNAQLFRNVSLFILTGNRPAGYLSQVAEK